MTKFKKYFVFDLDDTLVDAFHRITGETAAILGFNAATGEFVQMSASMIDADGARFAHPPITKDQPIYGKLTAGDETALCTHLERSQRLRSGWRRKPPP